MGSSSVLLSPKMVLFYTHQTVERINWTNFDPSNVYQIADLMSVNPDFLD